MTSFGRFERKRTRGGVPVSVYCLTTGAKLYVPQTARWENRYAALLAESLRDLAMQPGAGRPLKEH